MKKKIDTDELRELLELTETAQRIRNFSADDKTREITDVILDRVLKRAKTIKRE